MGENVATIIWVHEQFLGWTTKCYSSKEGRCVMIKARGMRNLMQMKIMSQD
jgi:hypothetical protein